MHTVAIRRASVDDAPSVARLSAQLGYPASDDDIRSRLEIVSSSPTDVVYAAIAVDELVGWIHLAEVPSLETETYAEIRAFVVSEAHRGRGVGLRLLGEAETWARSRGLFRLRVRSNVVREVTRAFYERRGFTVVKAQNVFDKILR